MDRRFPYSDFLASRRNRRLVVLVGLALSLSGIVWLLLHYMTGGSASTRRIEVLGLEIHGGAAMLMLVLLGGIFTGHAHARLRAEPNRRLGIALLACAAFLGITGYLLYYAGSEAVREQASLWHSVVGVLATAVFAGHFVLARRLRRRRGREVNPPAFARRSKLS